MAKKSYLVKFASGKNFERHCSFQLRSKGTFLGLSNPKGQKVDHVETPSIQTDLSWGRGTQDISKWVLYDKASPGQANSGTSYRGQSPRPTVSKAGGFYQENVSVEILSVEDKTEIRYTTDGTTPNKDSLLYKETIFIDKNTILKAACFAEGAMPSPVLTTSYFLNEKVSLPVVSLSTAPHVLFDKQKGLLMPGEKAEKDFPFHRSNFWSNKYVQMHIEFFEKGGVLGFSQDVAMRVYGNFSRGIPMKSFLLAAKKRYGHKRINYKLFEDRERTQYKYMLLRNSGDDWASTLIRDALQHRLVNDLDVETLAYRPCLLYINGRYWGIYNIRERISRHYLGENKGIDRDNIDLLYHQSKVSYGDAKDYEDILHFISKYGIESDLHYNEICQRIDIDNFIDYYATQIYVANNDWPELNIKYWRSKEKKARWRWFLYDLDVGFSLHQDPTKKQNILKNLLSLKGEIPSEATFLFRSLMGNEGFKLSFLNRLCDLLNSNFKEKRVKKVINELAAVVEPEIKRHHIRWNEEGRLPELKEYQIWSDDLKGWKKNINDLKVFSEERPGHVYTELKEVFGVDEPNEITLDVKGPGKIKINRLLLTQFPWQGKYLPGLLVKVTAVADEGAVFEGWSGASNSAELSIVINPKEGMHCLAQFSKK